jgi:PAS domain S-box-containing protein
MREDCGILVIGQNGRLLSSNSLAQFMLGQSLPPNMAMGGNTPVARLFTQSGYPLDALITEEKEKHGHLKGSELPESGLWFTSFPMCDEAHQVSGTVITLVKKDEQELDHALRFTGLSHPELMDRMPEGVFVVNIRWQIIYINETAQRITGFTKNEALGKFCWEIFRSDLCHKNCPMRVSMSTSDIMLDREMEILTKTGEKKLIMANTSQVKKAGGRIIGGMETFHECSYLKTSHKEPDIPSFSTIIGVSPQMQEIIERLPVIAHSDSNVLIQGESGTGKEMVAKAIHMHSLRRKGPFVAINCSAIPENLLESELFGHEKGAFTGAVASRPGRFELAGNGTLLLDEIGDLQPHLQVKLLRVLEERVFERVGGTRRIPMEARVIAATNVDLKEAIRQGKFREDLYYRLFTIPIQIPPLRERRDDIPILVKHFIERFNTKFDKQMKGVTPKVMKIFCNHPWPGNVRELQHVIEYCFVFVKGSIITDRHLPSMESSWTDRDLHLDTEDGPLQALERKAILAALETSSGNKQEAAKLLKISRSKLWRKMKAYSITKGDFKSERM